MKIKILIDLLPEDIEEINSQFGYEFDTDSLNIITVSTDHLEKIEPLDWIESWLDVGLSLEWNKELDYYVLTDNK